MTFSLVQGTAMQAWEEEGDFRAAIEASGEIVAMLGKDKLAQAFSLDRQLRHVDTIFRRVFGQ